MAKKTFNNTHYTKIFLQVGLAFVFAYAAFSSLSKPADWTVYLPSILISHIAPLTLIKLFAAFEIILVVWILIGKYLKIAALLSALTFASILILHPHQLIVTFRDVGLLCAALALVFV